MTRFGLSLPQMTGGLKGDTTTPVGYTDTKVNSNAFGGAVVDGDTTTSDFGNSLTVYSATGQLVDGVRVYPDTNQTFNILDGNGNVLVSGATATDSTWNEWVFGAYYDEIVIDGDGSSLQFYEVQVHTVAPADHKHILGGL